MEEALKMREEVNDDFMEWRRITEETEVILEVKRIQEDALVSVKTRSCGMKQEEKVQESVTSCGICPEATAPSANTS